MPNHTDTPEIDRKKAELVDMVKAGNEVFQRIDQKFPGIQINPDASLLQEFISYLMKIGIVSETQIVQFQIEHIETTIKGLKDMEKQLDKQKAEEGKKLYAPNPAAPKLIIPGRGM